MKFMVSKYKSSFVVFQINILKFHLVNLLELIYTL